LGALAPGGRDRRPRRRRRPRAGPASGRRGARHVRGRVLRPIRRVWVTRAEPGAGRTAERLAALGFEPMVVPLLAIRPLPCPPPDLTGMAALAFTGRNGVDAFAALTAERGLPVFAVGDATAERARR